MSNVIARVFVTSFATSVTLLAGVGISAAQSPVELAIGVPIENLGTFELVSGVITPPPPPGALFATPGVIYDNTCLPYAPAMPVGCGIVYINTLGAGESLVDDGRLPSVTSPAPNSGAMNAYRITSFDLIFYTSELDQSLGGPGTRLSVLFWEDYDRCTNLAIAAAPLRIINLTLPGTLAAGSLRGINISISLAGGQEFTMLADANGTYDAVGTLDLFGYGFRVTTLTTGAAIYFVRAGAPSGVNACAVGDATYYKNPGSAAGTGLANNNNYWQQLSATGGSCLAGAATGGCASATGPIWGGFYMRITADLTDCNANLLPDAEDITAGTSLDSNLNGIPDECETAYTTLCFCPAPQGPCGNNDPNAGCANSTGSGALMTPTGTTSVGADDLVLTTSGIPPAKSAVAYWSAAVAGPTPFFDGVRCLFAPAKRLTYAVSDANGVVVHGPGLAASQSFIAGTTVGFQVWYRDPTGPCGTTANISSAASVPFTP